MNKDDLMYLKPNFVAEPLIENWYAWSQLISPTTCGMYLINKNLPIMKSYMLSPKAHAAAVKNPQMLGGPFINYEGKYVEEITELYERTKNNNQDFFELSEAILKTEQLLKNEAKGGSLEVLYAKLPDCLKGYVELVYDLNDNPAIRFFEPLLYKSKFYKESLQSYQCYLLNDDDRPFVLSTPRIKQEGKIILNIPFKNNAIDELYKMVRRPNSYERIKEMLEIKDEDEEIFRSFFTTDNPISYQHIESEGIRTRYFGHACILIETKDVNILVDPVISYDYESDVERLTYQDLPDIIDYILITHNHQDHILLETILHLRHKVKNVVVPRTSGRNLQDPSLGLMLKTLGFENVIELDVLGEIIIPGGVINGLPFIGEHGDIDIACKLAYLVNLHGYKLMLLADSDNIDKALYENIHKIYGDVDTIFMGMECEGAPMSWLYGSLRATPLERQFDQERRLSGSNYKKGIEIVKVFNPKEVYVYAMGAEPWIKYISSIQYTSESYPIVESDKLIENCISEGIKSSRLFGTMELSIDNSYTK